ncbi:uncharacterized protein LOC116847218 isoform X2 [Odontomachus brunneus]|uniref:uncharacterized protein LOC116847218 isoform X2 n=1 Tax=Odontomachus brunneus TaxID=486640 RepID=UPI0013F18AAF|nr:uncharacterized protein LOC116847218 isoform X2 [Odontomachus brunneus]XP_032677859.1 uncharacterized protein LOC116847218 isoform X2 [Odontomachus brunneus]
MYLFTSCETGPHSGICSKHFQESDFIYKIYGADVRRFIKPGACPSLLQCKRNNKENTETVYEQNASNYISSENHDINDCTSSGDRDTKSDIIVNTSIKVEDISYEPIKIEGVTIEEASPMAKISLNSKTNNPLVGKRRCNTPRYIGDLRPEDFNSYQCWIMFHRYLTETRKKLKYLKSENNRLSNKVARLQVIFDHFKEKGLICSNDRDCFIESTKEITTSSI